MNLPTIPDDLLIRLGPETEAFERYNKNQSQENKHFKPREILVGEKKSFDELVINYTQNGIKNPKLADRKNLNFETRYLWIINTNGLFLLLESTPNSEASRKIVCHSNITRGEKALQGGELWFISQNHIIINYKSGRYGAENTIQENAVAEYFKLLGFEVEIE